MRPRPSRHRFLRRVLRAVLWSVGVALLVLVLVALTPFALREQDVGGPVLDTAAFLPGEAALASDDLRALGYSCSDVITTADAVTRSCSHVRHLTTARVQLVLSRGTGAVELAVVTTDEERPAQSRATYRAALDAVGHAVALSADERSTVRDAAGSTEDVTRSFGWGSLTVRPVLPVPAAESGATLRAAGQPDATPSSSTATLDVPVDAFATAARAHGYTCTTPEVGTVRSCERGDGSYAEELWLQGNDRYTEEVYVDVSSTFGTRTRSHWIATMDEAMSWVVTDQTRAVRTWLAGSADAPGADAYVAGLPVSFLVRGDTWAKETFGTIRAGCAGSVDPPSGCDDRTPSPGRPG